MALSSRELLLILRARDEMQSVIDSNSAALTNMGSAAETARSKTVGVGLALAGTGAVLKNAGEAAIAFGQSAVQGAIEQESISALIATQAQNLELSTDQISNIISGTAGKFATPIDGLNESLFEILSTVETDVPGATEVLEALALSGVAAGGSSADFAGVATASLNAFGLETSDTLGVLDSLFRAVEQGQGSYEGFAQGFASAIPSAQAFNQTLEDTFASVAFITKATGLSEAEAGTAVARTFDLFKKTDVRDNLDAIGVSVVDAGGNFRGILPILKELEGALGGLSDSERESKLEDLFGANARAFKFLNPAIADMEAFEDVLGEVNQGISDGSGIMGAYGIQSDTTATKVQELKNQFALFKGQVGAVLLPIFENLLSVGSRLLGLWDELSPATQEIIIKIAALAAVLAVIVGTIAIFVGGLLAGKAALGILGVKLGVLIATSGGLLLAFAALVAIAWLVYQNWDRIGPLFESIGKILLKVKDIIVSVFQSVVDAVQSVMAVLIPILQQFAEILVSSIKVGIDIAVAAFNIFIATLNAVWDAATTVFNAIVEVLQGFWDYLSSTFGPGLSDIWNTLVEEFNNLRDEFGETVSALGAWFNVLKTVAEVAWMAIKAITQTVWGFIGPFIMGVIAVIVGIFQVFGPTVVDIVTTAFNLVKDIIVTILNFIKALFGAWGSFLLTLIQQIWNTIVAIITAAITIVSNIIQLFMNIIQGDWDGAWQNIKNILKAAWTLITSIVRAAATVIAALIRALKSTLIAIFNAIKSAILAAVRATWSLVKTAFSTGVRAVMATVRTLPGRIRSIFSGAGRWLYNAGRRILTGLISGITSKIGAIRSKLRSVTRLIPSWKGPADKDKKLLMKNGELIMEGLGTGLTSGFMDVKRTLNRFTTSSNFMPDIQLGAQTAQTSNQPMDSEMLVQSFIRALERFSEDADGRRGLFVEGDLIVGNVDEVDELDEWSSIRFSGK